MSEIEIGLEVFDRRVDSPFDAGCALYVSPNDTLAAQAVAEWLTDGTLPAGMPVKVDDRVPTGFAFMDDGDGGGDMLRFITRDASAPVPTALDL